MHRLTCLRWLAWHFTVYARHMDERAEALRKRLEQRRC